MSMLTWSCFYNESQSSYTVNMRVHAQTMQSHTMQEVTMQYHTEKGETAQSNTMQFDTKS